MPKLDETTTTGGFFRIDGLPYQKGDYVFNLNLSDETLEIRPRNSDIKNSGSNILNIDPTGYADWDVASGSAYASFAALQTAVEGVSFFS